MTVPFNESIAGYNWPPKLVQSSTNCGDPLNDDLYPPDFTDTLSRIRSGYYPFGLEHSAYSNLLANAQINLDRCQNKLDCRVDVHETLEAHKQFLEAHIALISSLCSPIRKLPRELLEDIFEYVCCTGVSNHIAPRARYFSEDFRRRDLSHVARLSTLDLGQVCHYWNSVICSLPVLWSSFGFQEMKKSIVVKSGLELFLRRSSSHPIDLLINEFSNQVSEYSLPLLLPKEHSDRWRHVTIRTADPSSYLKPLIDSTTTRGLPSLTSLSLDGLFGCAFLDFPVPCPNLQSLSLKHIAVDLAFIRTTITHLDISHMSPGHAWVLISYCPNLKELLLKEIDLSLSDDNVLPLLYTCNARKLILEISESSISNLLFSINLPKLSCLELIDSDDLDSRSYSIEPLARMLDRSNANNLTHLSLRYVSFSFDRLLPLFSCTPSITDLEVVEVMGQLRGVYPILKLLICEDGGGEPEDVVFEDQEDIDQVDKAEDFIQPQVRSKACLLPKLENLRLVIRPRNQLLYTLVHSRWRPGTSDLSSQGQPVCLKSFYLRYLLRNLSLLGTRDLDELRRSLERFKKEGLNVQIGLAPSYNTTSAT